MNDVKFCSFGCERELKPNSKLDACPVCRANINGWERRRPAEVLIRRAKLVLYSTRMADVIGGRRRR
jgi:hypothetical protein